MNDLNMLFLRGNPYPGRGIVCGLDGSGKYLVQIYWIMGRSGNSRNRVLSERSGKVFTEPADLSKMTEEQKKLIIYNAMREKPLVYVVSNGDQTEEAINLSQDGDLGSVLKGRIYEPDGPNFTQRITGAFSFPSPDTPRLQLSILRHSLLGEGCDRALFRYDTFTQGCGYMITTYSGDGNPLPAFRGDPLLMPLSGGIDEITLTYWHALDEANRVALAVKFISIADLKSEVRIINKYKKV